MKLIIPVILILQFIGNVVFAQQFQTIFTAENSNGMDTVFIGYDTLASINIDKQFGEIDITDMQFDSAFEVKLGQIDLNELECGSNDFDTNNKLITYLSKIDILPMDCEEYDLNETINGLPPYSTLFVKNKDLPIVLRWDSKIFDDPCVEKSFITDWHPGGWFDATCSVQTINRLDLINQDSVLITTPSASVFIDSFGDSLSMFHIALRNKLISGNVERTIEESIEVFPNPTDKIVHIKSQTSSISSLELFDIQSTLITRSIGKEYLDLGSLPNGLYFLKIYVGEQFIAKTIVKNSQ